MNIEIVTRVAIPILGAIITYLIVPFIREKTTKEQRKNVYEVVKIAVFAAEQMADAGLIDVLKKEYVVEYINKKLEEDNKKISKEDLDAMVESAVKELNIAQVELNK